ncbi:MAG: secondary thiamine-phosphate synthase enzyme YjbQ [Thiogranum sp.]
MFYQSSMQVATRGRGIYSLSRDIGQQLRESDIRAGICLIFLHHTSASLILCENADPEVRADLERFMERLVPDGDPLFRHVDEGPDDMPAHVRSILTSNSLSVPVSDGRCDLGTWQGIYVWEHRQAPQRRRVTLTVYGE